MISTTKTDSTCKYMMPCGFCELKKENCDWWSKISVPYDYIKWSDIPIWNPKMNEVTCSAERSEDECTD